MPRKKKPAPKILFFSVAEKRGVKKNKRKKGLTEYTHANEAVIGFARGGKSFFLFNMITCEVPTDILLALTPVGRRLNSGGWTVGPVWNGTDRYSHMCGACHRGALRNGGE